MWHPRVVCSRFESVVLLLIVAAIALLPDIILGLANVSVTVPAAVRRGDNALLVCNYDMENDTLYSVKWYKGRREFYRYTPKENPAMKTFQTSGINVERTLSNQSRVVLDTVSLNISGKFSCEVSADAPTFHTIIVSADMEVVAVPAEGPLIVGIQPRYRVGDVINGNCSSELSKPAANLTWMINDILVPPKHIKSTEIQKNLTDNFESSRIEINFMVTPQHFYKGQLKLKCIARVYTIYEQQTEAEVEEDRPKILASGRSPESHFYPHEEELSGGVDEMYLTHYSAADLASSATKSVSSSSLLLQSISCVVKHFRTEAQMSKVLDGTITYVLISFLLKCNNRY